MDSSALNNTRESGWLWQPASVDIASGPAAPRGAPGEVLRNSKVYKCVFCKETGIRRLGGMQGAKCPVCRGRTKITITPPVMRCAFCNGTGEAKPRASLTCPVCKGKGLVSVREPFQTCPSCNGKGKMRGSEFYCPECKGKGVTPLRGEGSTSGAGRPAGTEKKVIKVIYQLEKGGRNMIADRLKISTAYAEQLLASLLKKKLLSKKSRDIFVLSPAGTVYMEERDNYIK